MHLYYKTANMTLYCECLIPYWIATVIIIADLSVLYIWTHNVLFNKKWHREIARFRHQKRRLLNSSFFWNWCNVNPDKITKCDQLWFRGFVSIIINPFLRVFAISAFLKVIHAPKTPKRRGISGTPKITFPHIFFQILAIGTSHKVYKHPYVKGFLTK